MAMRAITFAVSALGVAAACGRSGSGPASAPAPAPAPAVIATPRLTSDDPPVAQVRVDRLRLIDALRRARLLSSETCGVKAAAAEEEGVTITVWASCVAAQGRTIAAGNAGERRAAALDQCIAFELLAQVAEACGLAAVPEVGDAARTAAVNRLVELEFEQRYRGPADLAPQLDAVIKANEWRLHVPELRGSTFARFVVAKDAPAEVEARAHAAADQLAGELASRTGLFGVHLGDAARRIAATTGAALETTDFRLASRPEMVAPYADALFAIPEVGRTSPAFRTQWGWDIVLWTGGAAARERSRGELADELFPEVRRRHFQRWVTQLAKQLGVAIAIDAAAVARLDTEAAP